MEFSLVEQNRIVQRLKNEIELCETPTSKETDRMRQILTSIVHKRFPDLILQQNLTTNLRGSIDSFFIILKRCFFQAEKSNLVEKDFSIQRSKSKTPSILSRIWSTVQTRFSPSKTKLDGNDQKSDAFFRSHFENTARFVQKGRDESASCIRLWMETCRIEKLFMSVECSVMFLHIKSFLGIDKEELMLDACSISHEAKRFEGETTQLYQ